MYQTENVQLEEKRRDETTYKKITLQEGQKNNNTKLS